MATSYLLPGLAAYAKAIDLNGFKVRYPHHWIVWEVGDWQPPRASTIQMNQETFRKMVSAGESQAMALEERSGAAEGALQQITLGRSNGSDLVIPDGTVSERHLVFTREPGGWNVRDVGSRNGTTLNGQTLAPGQPHLLQSGEQVLAGQIRLTYYTPEGMFARARAAAAATPAPKR